ncbi:choice-of-anchor L domain-containing protein [Aestuariicoccus sp. MJ-SS9]|uniref:choice-of-anchor L domain-containing protein n=1 Tax=Aestuariicoccus sp. MJ-SS9 TaxID=3079855 RepID=UPI00290E4991|nr:choice-of-anchor L domain-containing protein [Aestuariicoccus sp. MJ-SS9]MDU8912150.1 choice-of-anchor L domain-containing protein [Aestuariicoccus sp. MJ-SS9]
MSKDTTDGPLALTRHAVIDGTDAPETLTGTGDADTINGLDGVDVIEAGAGDDVVLAGDGDDLVYGDAGNDTLDGEDGNDTLVGGAGDDIFVLSAGNDAYFGEQVVSTVPGGRDVLDMGATISGIEVIFADAGEGTATGTFYDARFFGIEVVIGSGLGDVIAGAGGDDTFEGGDGADLLSGGAGNDDLTGGAGNDILMIGTGDDTVTGGTGGDLLSGEDLNQAMVLTMTGAGSGALVLDNGDVTGFAEVESIRGSEFGDVMTGAGGADVFDGEGGDDTLVGGAGDDVLTGGEGSDVIDGGAGFDTAVLPETPSQAVIFLREDGSLRVLSADGDDIYRNVELFSFAGGVDVPLATMQAIAVPEPAPELGTEGDDTIFGREEIDVIEAGAGDDLVLARDGADLVNGGDGNDTLDGEGGDDTLVGGAGDDTLVLSTGSDAYFGDQAGTEPQAPADRDILDMSALTTTTTDAEGTYIVTGTNVVLTDAGIGTVALIDAATGAARIDEENRFFGIEEIVGSDLNDTFAGAGGDDVFAGGAGDDVVLASTGDDVLAGGAGGDQLSGETLDQAMTVTTSASGTGAFTLENGGLTSFTGMETIRGSDLDDTMTGGAGDDIFEGAGGDDIIEGGAGSDVAILSGTPSRYDYFLREDGSLRIVANADNPTDTGSDVYTGIETFRFDGGVEVPLSALEAIALPDTAGGVEAPSGDTTPLTGVRAPVGDDIASRADPAIGDALFGTENTPLLSIDYQGSPDAIGLLPEGYTVTDGAISVGIENGIFLTTGGGPGTQNTSTSFGENLGTPGNALLDAAVAAAFEDAGGTNDAAVLTFTFDSSLLEEGQETLALNVFFGSDEYPEFADSSFVDIAAVYVNGQNYALFNNDPEQPLSIVGESINTPGNFFSNGNDTFDTEYDGISALLTVLAPVVEGTNTVTIGIADTGDSIYDSGLWVGNLAGSDIDAFGSFVNVPGTQDNDVFDLNIAPQIVDLVGGRDLVRGSLAQLDNDVINGWGDNDLLLWTEDFDPAAVSVTADDQQAEIVVDLNGDGTAESRTLIFGNFSQAEFFVEAVSGGVQLYTIGVLPDPPIFAVGTDAGDNLRGGTGNDQLSGGAGQDTLGGGEGADTLAGGAGDDSITGDFGADSIGGGLGNDTIYGGAGNDIIGGGMDQDSVLGGTGNDIVNGGAGDDLLDGQAGNDTAGGSFGNDSVYGGTGNDSLGGGTGQDYLFGGLGDDIIGGGEGNDVIEGFDGANFLAGGGRDDLVIGGLGSDTINGGSGNDTLMGGAGADMFVFNDPRDGEFDMIVDFEVGVDTIRFTGGNVAAVDVSFAVIDDLPGVLLELGGHEIHLLGVIESEFDPGDMLFV